ncbi:acyltransferase family protein [Actinoplanes sp. CA-030573]|uniref:acyltransferase family protein n=1 Tax=Actinoplanes sp. CA-030573 TaxID=3239898 RepID=UPI003D8B0F6E
MRNRYLDLLRAAAIVRVIVYHLFGWPWLSIVLPAMGIMFALAGSLTAASLEKRAATKVVTSRLRRLLPPLWLLGLVAVPVMLVAGWQHEVDGEHPFSLPRLAFWIFPIGDPPGSDAGIDAWEPLWYIRAYVWFILLSPAMYACYRRLGWAAVAAPLALLAVLDVTGLTLPDTADAALWDFVTYGACWIAGFAHHDGRLRRLPAWIAWPVAIALGAAALYWLSGHQGEDPWDLNDVSESQALWSIAFVLIVLRWQPPMGWLARARPLDKLVTVLNARAVTVYLWHNLAIAAVWPVLTVVALDDLAGDLGAAADLTTALALTLLAVLLFGWVEDLAARRAPRLWPAGERALRPEEPVAPPPAPVVPPSRADARSYSAAAAMNRLPSSWPPPAPRTAEPFAGRHAADADTRLDLPVVGRRPADAITGEIVELEPPDRFRDRD